MVAIVSGNTPGLNLGSREVLGAAGMLGKASEGRNRQGVHVNASTGALVVQNQDDLLVARGLDIATVRTYDAQGNLRDVADARVHVTMDYDAVGNRSKIVTTVDYQGVDGEVGPLKDTRFFLYDEMNRQRVVDAADPAGTINAQQGHTLTYDKNGNRTSDTHYGNLLVPAIKNVTYVNSDGSVVYASMDLGYAAGEGFSKEQYAYDNLDRLWSVTKDDTQVDLRYYDGADRVVRSGPVGLPTQYADIINQGLAPDQMNGSEVRIYRYDTNGRLLHQRVRSSDGNVLKADISWDTHEILKDGNYFARTPRGYDAVGNVLGYVVKNYESGGVTQFTTGLAKFEGYQASVTSGESSKTGAGSTTQQYDTNGFLVRVTDATQSLNNRSFVNDASGRTLFVNQADGRIERQLIVNGEVLGTYGVGVDPVLSSASSPVFANVEDFNFGFASITASYPNASPGAYTVRTGDTLQGIAQSAYGDSSLWYRIADANGLASSSELKVGQTLNIPNRVSTISNNGTTFKPYDPSRIQGSMTPNLPMPDKDCGGLGQLMMLVVAIVVTIYTAGTAAAAMSAVGGAGTTGVAASAASAVTLGDTMVAGMTALSGGYGATAAVITGAIGGAVGSIASQGVGLAAGVIDRFDWKGVALAAIGSGLTGGLQGGMLGSLGGSVIGRAVVANALTQGIGVVTGLQKHFDWRSVAASGLGAAVGEAVGSRLGLNDSSFLELPFADQVGKRLVTGLFAGAATALARGGKVTIQQVAVDAFGNALGESLAAATSADATRTMAAGPALVSEGDTGGLKVSQALCDSWGPKINVPDPLLPPAQSWLSGGAPRLSDVLSSHDVLPFERAYSEGGAHDEVPVYVDPDTGASTSPVQQRVLLGRPLPPLALLADRSDARSSAFDYWTEVQDDGVRQGSLVKYAFGGMMRTVSGVGHDAWQAAVGATENPWDMVNGARKAIPNFGPEMFNGVTNTLKTTLDGYTLIAEKLGFNEGTFAPFREGNPYNITPLYKYANKTEAAAGFLTSFAMAAAAATYGGYAIEFDTTSAGTTFANPFGVKVVSPRYQPGVVTYGDELVAATGKWLDSGTPAPIPLQVAKQLKGQSFETFDDLRGAIWQAVARDAELSKGFGLKNLEQMESGYAPFAPRAFQNEAFGLRFNLHHVRTIGSGGPVYNLSNIRIVSPKTHYGLHYE